MKKKPVQDIRYNTVEYMCKMSICYICQEISQFKSFFEEICFEFFLK